MNKRKSASTENSGKGFVCEVMVGRGYWGLASVSQQTGPFHICLDKKKTLDL